MRKPSALLASALRRSSISCVGRADFDVIRLLHTESRPGPTARAPSHARLVGMDSGLPFRPPYPLRRHRGHARVTLKATGPCRAGHTCKTSTLLSISLRRVVSGGGGGCGGGGL